MECVHIILDPRTGGVVPSYHTPSPDEMPLWAYTGTCHPHPILYPEHTAFHVLRSKPKIFLFYDLSLFLFFFFSSSGSPYTNTSAIWKPIAWYYSSVCLQDPLEVTFALCLHCSLLPIKVASILGLGQMQPIPAQVLNGFLAAWVYPGSNCIGCSTMSQFIKCATTFRWIAYGTKQLFISEFTPLFL
jgi:hypothetical protein